MKEQGLVPYHIDTKELLLAQGMRVSGDARIEHAVLVGERGQLQTPQRERRIVAIGGNTSDSNLQRFARFVPSEAPITIISTPTTIPDEQFDGYKGRFKSLGMRVEPFHLRADTLPFEGQAMLRLSQGVWGTGGNQERGRELLVQKGLVGELLASYEAGKVIGGTSAGAHMLSEITSIGREGTDGSSTVEEIEGVGLVKGISFETHNDRRLRKDRQDKLVSETTEIGRDIVSIGLPESDGVIFDQNNRVESLGNKSKTIVWQRNGVVDDLLLRSNDTWVDIKNLPRTNTFYSFYRNT